MRAESDVIGYSPSVLIQPTEKQKDEKCWDTPDYRRVSPGENSVFLFRDLVRPKKGDTIIDFGCGTGRGGHSLAALCKLDVTLVDFATNCLDDEVEDALEEFPERMRFIEKDLSKSIGLKAKFGFCCDVMEHFPTEQVPQAIRNIMDCVEGCFFQICLKDDHYGKVIGHPLHLTVKPAEWWIEQFEKDHFVRWHQESADYIFMYVSRAAGVGNLLKHLRVNTPIDVRKDHVKANMAMGLPEATPHEVQDIEVMILAGGPSLNEYEDDIRAKRAVEDVTLNKRYHNAVEHGRGHNFKGYETLLDQWEKYLPTDERFCLCAKMELGTPDVIQIGDHKGEKKRENPDELTKEEARHLLAIIKAQASTEFGSIQQHSGTLERAHDDQDRYWVLRVMPEELRHGYQMLHLLLSKDWSHVSGGVTGEQMVEEILSMQTGNHVLDAFNLDYDSFIDNIVFAALIDRVGKYQLTVQKGCAYKPMAYSLPHILRGGPSCQKCKHDFSNVKGTTTR